MGLFTSILLLAVGVMTGGIFWLHARLKRTERLAELSEKSRASRVRSEVARQVAEQHALFINRYVHYFSKASNDIEAAAKQLMKDREADEYRKMAGEVVRLSCYLSLAISTLQEYASLERKELPLRLEAISSRLLLDEAIGAMRGVANKHNNKLLLDIGAWQEKRLVADKGKFAKMLKHVMHAAMVFLPPESVCTFTAESIDAGNGHYAAWLQLASPDYAQGMAADVFDPLSYECELDTKSGEELGILDMAFARQLAELMGGKLIFRSGKNGSYAEIELFLHVEEQI